MPLFIVDTCADTVEGQKKYIASFFRDVRSINGFCLVVGGTKMSEEIKRKAALFSLVGQLKKAGRVLSLKTSVVDEKADVIRARVDFKLDKIPEACDDFHILALCLLSSCQNLITSEQRIRTCIDTIRSVVGQDYCPQVRLIRDDNTYLQLKNAGKL